MKRLRARIGGGALPARGAGGGPGARLLDFVTRNLPRNKPQLWRHLPRALVRRTQLAWHSRRGDEWQDRPHVVQLGRGLRMEVVPRDAIGQAIYLYGIFEVATTAFVLATLREGDVFLDVGANAGYYALLASAQVGPAGRVIAFEPVASLRAALQRNLALNGAKNVEARPEAVWSTPGSIDFYDADSGSNSGLSSALPGPGRSHVPRKVPATTLDEVAARVPRVDLVKIDVEGGEGEVIAGAPRLLSGPDPPTLLFESHDVGPAAERLAGLGYVVRFVDYRRGSVMLAAVGREKESPFADYEAPNYVAIKPGGPGWRFLETERGA